jgi:anthranilate synthase component 1
MNDQAQKAVRKLVPVVDTVAADLLTPLGVFLKLSKAGGASFLLESVEGGESLARYSFIGTSPEMIVRGDNEAIEISDTDGKRKVETGMLDFLREHFDAFDVATESGLPPFVGGAIGYFGFNCASWFEPTLDTIPDENLPDAEFMFFNSVIAFDHAKQIIKIISLSEAGDQEKAFARNSKIRRVLENDPIVLPKDQSPKTEAQTTSNWKRDDFENAVREIKELILAGECYQVVISQCFSRETSADAVSIYRAMRSLNPSPYMFLLQLNDRSVIGASPEMLVKCSDRELEYRPIAGTRRRGKTSDEDAQLADEMRADKKEVAEHLMLVDLGRNDLGRVAEYGSVKVDGLMSVEKYSHVQHLVSYLSATLRPEFDRFDALAACFPAGTVSGAPKVRAIEIIQKMEPTPRGIYAGAVGYFDYSGNMDTCITIRTLVLEDGVARVQAGAGIVADSVPELEFEETVNKARALLKAIEIAEGGQ